MNINLITKYRINETVYFLDLNSDNIAIHSGRIAQIVAYHAGTTQAYYYKLADGDFLFTEADLHRSYDEADAHWMRIRQGLVV